MDSSMDLKAHLPELLPLAVSWAEQRSLQILQEGRPLNAAGIDIARRVGVQNPAAVRVLVVAAIPAPEHPLLSAACKALSFLGPTTAGLTLGHGIYVRADLLGDGDLIAHELRHVAQYEAHATIAAYLAVYIPQLLEHGYDDAPLEEDARQAAAART